MYRHRAIYKKSINKKKEKCEESEDGDKNVGELFKTIIGAESGGPGSSSGRVYCEENHIYFYDDVNTNSILDL